MDGRILGHIATSLHVAKVLCCLLGEDSLELEVGENWELSWSFLKKKKCFIS